MRIEKIQSINKEVKYPKRTVCYFIKSKQDGYADTMKKYVELAKVAPISLEALEILLKLEVGEEYSELIKETMSLDV